MFQFIHSNVFSELWRVSDQQFPMLPSITDPFKLNCWLLNKAFEFLTKLLFFRSSPWKIYHGGSTLQVLLPIAMLPSESRIQQWKYIQMQI